MISMFVLFYFFTTSESVKARVSPIYFVKYLVQVEDFDEEIDSISIKANTSTGDCINRLENIFLSGLYSFNYYLSKFKLEIKVLSIIIFSIK